MTEHPGPLGKIYSLTEAAEYLRVSKQAISRAARRHGIGIAFGRTMRFSEPDVVAIWEAVRIPPNHEPIRMSASSLFSEEKAYANLRKMAEAKRHAVLAERQRRRETGKREREETLSEKAARLLTNERRKPKPAP